MTPRVLVVQNDSDKSLGLIGEAFAETDVDLDVRMTADELPDATAYDGLIALPGLADPDDDVPGNHRVRALMRSALAHELPVLGICLGGQLLVQVLGGETYESRKELGFDDVVRTPAGASDELLAGVPDRFSIFHAHAYAFRPPAGAEVLLENDACVQACRLGNAWAFQCHPEPTLEWIDALARGIRGEPSWIEPGTAAFFASNGVDPESLRRMAEEASATATVVAEGIARGFAAYAHACHRARALSG